MNIEDIQKLIELARAHDIDEIEIVDKNSKVRITGRHQPPKVRYVAGAAPAPQAVPAASPAGAPVHQSAAPYAPEAAPPAPAPQTAPPAAPSNAPAASSDDADACPPGCVEVESPMVGTFYRAPAPDAPPFTDVGQSVDENDTVCIIEAMKLMNEIKAETRGVVRKVLVENGEPVEFGQPLFYIEKS
jgi:acetyl-CoA carboxylase biotin carboxyl carrier protein